MLYFNMPHSMTSYHTTPYYTTLHYTIPPLPFPHHTSPLHPSPLHTTLLLSTPPSPHHPGKKSTKESTPAYLAASNMYSNQEIVLLLWAAYHLDKGKDKENDKEKDKERTKNKIGK